ncbi:MAG: hypothetical protein JWN24_2997 [Phycisphaerales bacterium]|nr:hypothetical protein [Phycisphaerales bacterium]
MALEGAVYEFSGKMPTLDQISRKIRALAMEELIIEGTFDPTPSDEREAARARECTPGFLTRSTRATVRRTGEARRGGHYLDLTVSLDGTKLCVNGNDVRHFKLICKALSGLGGKPWVPPNRPTAKRSRI